ncbi:MAG TPA: bifunctional riboflavin kinase/FAD synthetase [Candidatus Binatia bacterium]|jgi:riboflavin kinase/FMN adenylyltransferase|nr:bifunctional riboflavin kinase/FAD synthetase [Candidatus Binatia bacterium]
MRVIRHLSHQAPALPRVVLTLGNFDGVHLGHQAIVQRAAAEARAVGGQVVVLTFHPHPTAVLVPHRAPARIQSLHGRLLTLRTLGVEVAVVQRFTRAFAGLEPEAFVRDLLMRRLELLHVVVGYNVSFGRDRAGTVDTLRALGTQYGFAVDAVGPVMVDGDHVSSTVVRRLIAAGDVRRVARLLGRQHQLRGRVVGGDRRGRTIGFPTANMHQQPGVLLPADGVYAVWATVDGVRRPAVLNVGVRPTFGELRRTVEAHVLDFDGDLYGRWLCIDLVERLRGEMKFSGPGALVAAIKADVIAARQHLAG